MSENGTHDLAATVRELEAKLEAKRRARESRDADRDLREQAKRAENALLYEDLVERFSEEQGEQGIDFAICDLTSLDKGYVVVKRGVAALVRKYKGKFQGDRYPSEADTHDLVKANLLHPDVEEFKRIASDHDFVAIKIANVICDMHGVALEMKGGKR